MSTCLRSTSTRRAAQSFHSTGSLTQPVRRLHITGAKDSPSQFMRPAGSSLSTRKSNESRTFNTSRAMKHPNDTSTIDLTFLPDSASLQPGMVSTAAMNIPILPSTFRTAPRRSSMSAQSNAVEDISAKVQTVSMTMPGQVAVLSEVDVATVDGREMDVFRVVENVSKSVAGSVKQAVEGVATEAGVMREVWEGMVGDIVQGGNARVA